MLLLSIEEEEGDLLPPPLTDSSSYVDFIAHVTTVWEVDLLAVMSECTPAPVPLVVYIPQVIDEFVRETPVLSLVGQEWKDTAR